MEIRSFDYSCNYSILNKLHKQNTRVLKLTYYCSTIYNPTQKLKGLTPYHAGGYDVLIFIENEVMRFNWKM